MNKEGVVPLFIEANNEEFVNGRQTQNRNVAERDREYKLQVRRPSICQSWGHNSDSHEDRSWAEVEIRWSTRNSWEESLNFCCNSIELLIQRLLCSGFTHIVCPSNDWIIDDIQRDTDTLIIWKWRWENPPKKISPIIIRLTAISVNCQIEFFLLRSFVESFKEFAVLS